MIWLIYLYQGLWQFKHLILTSFFGFSSHCKHNPTCSKYWVSQIKLHGTIDGSWRGLGRLLSCW